MNESATIDAKTQIILTAERLFAEGGINGVSMREIASKAEQGNHYAVQYHFGSREGLVQAIFDHRMLEMEPVRGQMLEDLRDRGLTDDARAIMEVVLLPQLELDGGDNRSYGAFLSQFLLQSQWKEFGVFGHEAPPNLRESLRLLRARVHYLPEVVAQRRLINVSLMFLNLLVHHMDEDARVLPEPFETALEDTMDQIITAMCMPLRRL